MKMFALTCNTEYADKAIVTVPFGSDEATINPNATLDEIKIALKLCAVQLVKVNNILLQAGLKGVL
jgi:hypothetical protein